MTTKTLKNRFAKLGFEAVYQMGEYGLAWYLRKYGATDFAYIGDKIMLEEKLYRLEEKAE